VDDSLNLFCDTKKYARILNNLLKVGKQYFSKIKKNEKYKNNSQKI
jgi:hypothetical protein